VDPGSSYDTGAGACIALHAEQNVLLWADPMRVLGGTMYVTDRPCDGCERMLKGSGLKEVRFPGGHMWWRSGVVHDE
jgi:dCMP deaminase